MELQQSYFDIQYQKETLNRVAEALSRQSVSSSANREPEIVGDRDVEGAVRPLVEGVLIESGTDTPTRRELRSRSNGMKLEGLQNRQNQRSEVLNETLDAVENGHLGKRVGTRYFWPGWRYDVKRHVRSC